MTTNPGHAQPAGDAARQQADQLKGHARGAAQDMAGSAREEAAYVKDEAMGQARSLAASAKDEVRSQAETQQQRLAQQSRVAADDLQRLARGEQPESDLVSQVVSSVADGAQKFTSALENKTPEDLLTDVRRFAARRPGAFLAVAAGIGFAAGRLTRGLADNDETPPHAGRQNPAYPARPAAGYSAAPGAAYSARPEAAYPARPMPAPAEPTLGGSPDVEPARGFDPLTDPNFGRGPGEVPDGTVPNPNLNPGFDR